MKNFKEFLKENKKVINESTKWDDILDNLADLRHDAETAEDIWNSDSSQYKTVLKYLDDCVKTSQKTIKMINELAKIANKFAGNKK